MFGPVEKAANMFYYFILTTLIWINLTWYKCAALFINQTCLLSTLYKSADIHTQYIKIKTWFVDGMLNIAISGFHNVVHLASVPVCIWPFYTINNQNGFICRKWSLVCISPAKCCFPRVSRKYFARNSYLILLYNAYIL